MDFSVDVGYMINLKRAGGVNFEVCTGGPLWQMPRVQHYQYTLHDPQNKARQVVVFPIDFRAPFFIMDAYRCRFTFTISLVCRLCR